MADLIFYDKAAVKVTVGSTSEVLLASDCSVSFSSSLQPLYAIGRKGSLGQFPSAARAGEISFSFLTSITGEHDKQPGNIINYLASGIKGSINSNASGALIQVAGLSGTGFLSSYSFNVASNSVSTSSASFTLFGSGEVAATNNQNLNVPISGRLANSDYSPSTGANPAAATNSVLATGIGHGRFTNLDGFRTELTGPTSNGTIFGADYSISFNHNPIYKVGQEFPSCTYYTTASESMNITEDVFNSGLSFSGVDVGDVMLNVKGLDSSKQMQVGLSGLEQINSSASVGLDDIVRTQKTLVAAY